MAKWCVGWYTGICRHHVRDSQTTGSRTASLTSSPLDNHAILVLLHMSKHNVCCTVVKNVVKWDVLGREKLQRCLSRRRSQRHNGTLPCGRSSWRHGSPSHRYQAPVIIVKYTSLDDVTYVDKRWLPVIRIYISDIGATLYRVAQKSKLLYCDKYFNG